MVAGRGSLLGMSVAALLAAGRLSGRQGLAVGLGDRGGDQGDVGVVQASQDVTEPDGDGLVAEAGGDAEDGFLGGAAGQSSGLEGVDGGLPADDGEGLAGGDAGAGGDDTA